VGVKVKLQYHALDALPQERALGTQWIGGWASPKASLDTVVKGIYSCPCQELNPRSAAHRPVNTLTELYKLLNYTRSENKKEDCICGCQAIIHFQLVNFISILKINSTDLILEKVCLSCVGHNLEHKHHFVSCFLLQFLHLWSSC
jgi:hypothetical protein